jgi:hypothetical protein
MLLEIEAATASIDSAAPVAKANQNHIEIVSAFKQELNEGLSAL